MLGQRIDCLIRAATCDAGCRQVKLVTHKIAELKGYLAAIDIFLVKFLTRLSRKISADMTGQRTKFDQLDFRIGVADQIAAFGRFLCYFDPGFSGWRRNRCDRLSGQSAFFFTAPTGTERRQSGYAEKQLGNPHGFVLHDSLNHCVKKGLSDARSCASTTLPLTKKLGVPVKPSGPVASSVIAKI